MIDQTPYTTKRRRRVERLTKGENLAISGMAKNRLYGLLTRGPGLVAGGYTDSCRACLEKFRAPLDAQLHLCPNEVEFREITHSAQKVFLKRRAGLKKTRLAIKRKAGINGHVPPQESGSITEWDSEKFVLEMADIIKERNQLRELCQDHVRVVRILNKQLEDSKERETKFYNELQARKMTRVPGEVAGIMAGG